MAGTKRLNEYLIKLSEDAEELKKYRDDRDRALAESGLADHHQDILRRNDHQEIQRAVHAEDQEAKVTSVPLLAQYMVAHVVKHPPKHKKHAP